ncbi:hypothetical protein HMPREF2835_01365, partial [Actinomyces sp. HMSC072A03]
MKPSHFVIILIVLLVVFGASKLPDIARSLGQSAKVLKKEMRELSEDDGSTSQAGQIQQSQVQAQPGQPAQYQQPVQG